MLKRILLGFILILSLITIVDSGLADDLPDLIVEDIIWLPKDPGVGEDIKIQVHIRNVGDAPVSKSFRFKIELKNAQDIYWEFDEKEPLNPGEGYIGFVTITWRIREGDYEINAEVDYTRQVKESDEKNNKLTVTIPIGPEVTTYASKTTSDTTTKVKGTTTMAIVTDVEYPTHVEPGEQFEISVTIDYSSSYEVQVWLYDVELDRDIDYIEESFGPYAGTKTYTFQVTAPSEVGIWTITAGVWYILPYSMDPSRVYKHSEEDWKYDLKIYVGIEKTTKTTSVTSSYETTSQFKTDTIMTSTPQYTSTEDTITTVTTEKASESKLFSIGQYGTFIPIIVIIIIFAIIAVYWIRRQSSARPTQQKCIKCKSTIPSDAEYCDECGTRQKT